MIMVTEIAVMMKVTMRMMIKDGDDDDDGDKKEESAAPSVS